MVDGVSALYAETHSGISSGCAHQKGFDRSSPIPDSLHMPLECRLRLAHCCPSATTACLASPAVTQQTQPRRSCPIGGCSKEWLLCVNPSNGLLGVGWHLVDGRPTLAISSAGLPYSSSHRSAEEVRTCSSIIGVWMVCEFVFFFVGFGQWKGRRAT